MIMEKLKILVVDDESRMRKIVRDFLVRKGYEVHCFGDFGCYDAQNEWLGSV